MSSCWKCGRELPEGQVECEYGCGPIAIEERALGAELKTGDDAAEALARHVHRMGAAKFQRSVRVADGAHYLVAVSKVNTGGKL